MPIRPIRTADNQEVKPGDRVFSHYTMTELTIVSEPDPDGWVYLRDDDGKRELLNGERICSLAHARRMHWL